MNKCLDEFAVSLKENDLISIAIFNDVYSPVSTVASDEPSLLLKAEELISLLDSSTIHNGQ
jgi:hypothetical protein